jgi:hypothetical protein
MFSSAYLLRANQCLVCIPVLPLVSPLPLLPLAILSLLSLQHVTMDLCSYRGLSLTVLRLSSGHLSRSLSLNERCFAFHFNVYNRLIQMTNMGSNANALTWFGDSTSTGIAPIQVVATSMTPLSTERDL